ncbi:unnamed protein product [Lepeophtheirus salmonis]|uniref:(salmon louse) hypothetical protein n=1 Tax=Lepeophtheirus salmonis TaxID=72036 RepID=A0A7R8CS66_LEPSM|nr:unnamed protein product [Lepeophtheirus salmonis]CAF2874410.1 unnamed protein product [Lepeophtheirus salmonis]
MLVTYFEDNVIEVEIEIRDSREDHMEEDAILFRHRHVTTLIMPHPVSSFPLQSYDLDHLIYFFNCLGPAATNLKYRSKLSPLEECILTLVNLRRNTQDFELTRFFMC